MIQEPIEETVVDGQVVESSRPGREESWRVPDGKLPDAIEARIAALSAKDEPVVETVETVEPVEGVEKLEDLEAKPVEEATPVAETESPAADPVKTEIERYQQANAQLVAELEALRGAPPELPEHLTKLDKAASSYLDDDIGSVRAYIAHAIGVEPDAKEVDAELEYLYTSLTSKSLGVTPDPAHQAARENARTRQILAREKRERKAEGQASEAKVKAEAEAKAAREAAEFIGTRIDSKSAPLTVALAEIVDGKPAGAVIWQTIQREARAGRFDKETMADDAKLIAAATKIVEDRYASIAARLTPPPTKPSTVTPSAQAPIANESSAKSAQPAPPPSSKARTLTNADASVAPAATPAKKPATTQEKPKFKSDAERREWALRRLPK